MTDENDDLEKLENEDITDPTEYNSRLQKIMTKLKFKCFGKVSFSNKCNYDKPLENLYSEKSRISSKNETEKIQEVENQISDLLIKKQRKEYEKKLSDLKLMSEKKGKCAATFRLKAMILGEKKEKQEAVVIEDPDTEELLFDAETIKAASLKYLKDLLRNCDPREG